MICHKKKTAICDLLNNFMAFILSSAFVAGLGTEGESWIGLIATGK